MPRQENRIKIFKNRAHVYENKETSRFFIVDVDDVPLIKNLTWWFGVCPDGKLRAITKKTKRGKSIYVYRLLLSAKEGKFVDHIDRNTLNNRRSNLRICTKQQNAFNSKLRIDNTSGFKGVCYWHPKSRKKGYWIAHAKAGNERLHSYHKTKEEAASAYTEFAKRHHGEFFYNGDKK